MKEADIKGIHSVRVYQSVQFDKSQRTFFSIEDNPMAKGCEISIIENVGVELKSPTDHVIVPFPNISGIYLDTKSKKQARDEMKKDISKPATAQHVGKVKVDPVGAKRL